MSVILAGIVIESVEPNAVQIAKSASVMSLRLCTLASLTRIRQFGLSGATPRQRNPFAIWSRATVSQLAPPFRDSSTSTASTPGPLVQRRSW